MRGRCLPFHIFPIFSDKAQQFLKTGDSSVPPKIQFSTVSNVWLFFIAHAIADTHRGDEFAYIPRENGLSRSIHNRHPTYPTIHPQYAHYIRFNSCSPENSSILRVSCIFYSIFKKGKKSFDNFFYPILIDNKKIRLSVFLFNSSWKKKTPLTIFVSHFPENWISGCRKLKNTIKRTWKNEWKIVDNYKFPKNLQLFFNFKPFKNVKFQICSKMFNFFKISNKSFDNFSIPFP